MTVTLDEIRTAAARIDGQVVKTPMNLSRTLTEIIGAEEVWLKFENLRVGRHLLSYIPFHRYANATVARFIAGYTRLRLLLSRDRPSIPADQTLGEYLRLRRFSQRFVEVFIVPTLTLACSCSSG